MSPRSSRWFTISTTPRPGSVTERFRSALASERRSGVGPDHRVSDSASVLSGSLDAAPALAAQIDNPVLEDLIGVEKLTMDAL